MEPALCRRRSLDQGMWVFSRDLKNVFTLHPLSRKYLRICTGEKVFHLRALPFGIFSAHGSSPRCSNSWQLSSEKKNIAIHQYLDDWLNKQWSREKSLLNRERTLHLCQQAAYFINWNKSELTPTQQFDFEWVHFDLQQGLVCPATEKNGQTYVRGLPILQQPVCSSSDLGEFVGISQ